MKSTNYITKEILDQLYFNFLFNTYEVSDIKYIYEICRQINRGSSYIFTPSNLKSTYFLDSIRSIFKEKIFPKIKDNKAYQEYLNDATFLKFVSDTKIELEKIKDKYQYDHINIDIENFSKLLTSINLYYNDINQNVSQKIDDDLLMRSINLAIKVVYDKEGDFSKIFKDFLINESNLQLYTLFKSTVKNLIDKENVDYLKTKYGRVLTIVDSINTKMYTDRYLSFPTSYNDLIPNKINVNYNSKKSTFYLLPNSPLYELIFLFIFKFDINIDLFDISVNNSKINIKNELNKKIQEYKYNKKEINITITKNTTNLKEDDIKQNIKRYFENCGGEINENNFFPFLFNQKMNSIKSDLFINAKTFNYESYNTTKEIKDKDLINNLIYFYNKYNLKHNITIINQDNKGKYFKYENLLSFIKLDNLLININKKNDTAYIKNLVDDLDTNNSNKEEPYNDLFNFGFEYLVLLCENNKNNINKYSINKEFYKNINKDLFWNSIYYYKYIFIKFFMYANIENYNLDQIKNNDILSMKIYMEIIDVLWESNKDKHLDIILFMMSTINKENSYEGYKMLCTYLKKNVLITQKIDINIINEVLFNIKENKNILQHLEDFYDLFSFFISANDEFFDNYLYNEIKMNIKNIENLGNGKLKEYLSKNKIEPSKSNDKHNNPSELSRNSPKNKNSIFNNASKTNYKSTNDNSIINSNNPVKTKKKVHISRNDNRNSGSSLYDNFDKEQQSKKSNISRNNNQNSTSSLYDQNNAVINNINYNLGKQNINKDDKKVNSKPIINLKDQIKEVPENSIDSNKYDENDLKNRNNPPTMNQFVNMPIIRSENMVQQIIPNKKETEVNKSKNKTKDLEIDTTNNFINNNKNLNLNLNNVISSTCYKETNNNTVSLKDNQQLTTKVNNTEKNIISNINKEIIYDIKCHILSKSFNFKELGDYTDIAINYTNIFILLYKLKDFRILLNKYEIKNNQSTNKNIDIQEVQNMFSIFQQEGPFKFNNKIRNYRASQTLFKFINIVCEEEKKKEHIFSYEIKNEKPSFFPIDPTYVISYVNILTYPKIVFLHGDINKIEEHYQFGGNNYKLISILFLHSGSNGELFFWEDDANKLNWNWCKQFMKKDVKNRKNYIEKIAKLPYERIKGIHPDILVYQKEK